MKKTLLNFFFIVFTLTSLAQNHSLDFDGTDDFVDLQQNFAFEATDRFTIEAWINISSIGSFQQIIAKLGNGVLSFRGWGFQVTDDGILSAFISTEFFTQTRYVEGEQILQTNTWYHVAMSFDGEDEILLYVNGAPETLGVVNPDGELTTIATSAPTHIGNFDNGTAQEHFNGKIDELRVWSGVRSTEEIATAYMTELSGNETNLLGYYKMDVTNSSCDVQDCHVNENHGDREGSNGANDLPQFSDDVPEIDDVACGVDLDCTLSVDEVVQLEFSVYPNPAESIISFSGVHLEETNVTLYNVLGSAIKETRVVNNSIDISEIPTGIYFMVATVNNVRISKKIIKK
ncbi:LamG-like jellyroll fold domain-containing protein [Dokdonia sp.]|uniref:LamG-like jellyroll fold domain-containing protein n=1 Tax=Dokdonia sp. TaxID=2024995 RepID=UPI0032663853